MINYSYIVRFITDIIFAPIAFIFAFISRFLKGKIDIGLGPEPLISYIYHKQALEQKGYSAETYVSSVYFITNNFDYRADRIFKKPFTILIPYWLFLRSILRYKCLYIHFHGGSLLSTAWLWRLEPLFYKIAGLKVVVMPYGSDVQDMTRSKNLLFKDAMSNDYPEQCLKRAKVSRRIDLWTKSSDHVISGCEWVDYMYHWDTLMLLHFPIDTEAWRPVEKNNDHKKLRILHAPNHRKIKGSEFFTRAVSELIEEGLAVELVILEGEPNGKIKDIIANVDVVADQLIVGWYAMLALEAMSMEKPVLCYLREDLEHLYTVSGLIDKGEIPIINCNPLNVKEKIKLMIENKNELLALGKRSREFVLKHHSLDVVGETFDEINKSIGLRN